MGQVNLMSDCTVCHKKLYTSYHPYRLLRFLGIWAILAILLPPGGGCVESPLNDGVNGIDSLGDVTGGNVSNDTDNHGGNNGTTDDPNNTGGTNASGGADGPAAPDLSFATIQNQLIDLSLESALLKKQFDLSQPWSVTILSLPNGVLSQPTLDAQGELVVRYQPPANFVGTTRFDYSIRQGAADSQTGVVSIRVYPEILFSVTFEGDLTVRSNAYTVTGEDLPEGTYIWHFDDHQEAGPVSNYAMRMHTFSSCGAHFISLTVLLSGLADPLITHTARGAEQIKLTLNPVISGQVRDASDNPLTGVQIDATGLSPVTTDAQGHFTIAVPYGWSGEITPVHPQCWFEPPSRTFTGVDADRLNQSFLNVPRPQLTISGRLFPLETLGAHPPIGLQELTFEGSGDFAGTIYTATSTIDGAYMQEVPYGWTGVLKAKNATCLALIEPRNQVVFGNTSGSDAPPVTENYVQDLTIYAAPIGVPLPTFGIAETHRTYAGKRFDFNGNGNLDEDERYRDAGNGPYTHYIDNTHPDATDADNDYGSPSRPRLTIPAQLNAGAVVEIHGGPYTGGQLIVTTVGTADAPVYIRGVSPTDRPEIQKEVIAKGAYVIFENLRLYRKSFSLRPHSGSSLHHAAIRHNEIAGDGTIGGGCQLDIYGQSSAFNHDLIVYDNHIHHNGDSEAGEENDVHGVSIAAYVNNVWVLDNHIHHNGGDAFQVKSDPHNIYVGRNLMHDDRENAVDVKLVHDIIVSQNVAYGYEPTCSSEGAGIVVHYDAVRVWIMSNRVSASQMGVVCSGADPLYIVNNEIHDIVGTAIAFWNSGTLHIVGNTIVRAALGVHGNTGNTAGHLINNLIVQRSGEYDILYETVALGASSDMHHNLVYGGAGGVKIHWGGILYQTIAAFKAGSEKGEGCLEADPCFVNPPDDFHLQGESPAVDGGALPDVYNAFESLYGLDIRRDCEGMIRPQHDKCDIGAYER